MARQKKEHHSIAIRMASDIYDRLESFCRDSGQTKTFAVEQALVKYMDEYYKGQELIKAAKGDCS